MGMTVSRKKSPRHSSGTFWLFIALAIAVAMVGFSLFRHAIRRAQDVRFLREVMLLQESLAQFVEQSSDEVPTRSRLQSERVERVAGENAIDGQWHLRHSDVGAKGIVTELIIEAPNRSIKEMEAIDAIMDDGDLTTGNLVLRGHDSYSVKLLGEKDARGNAENETKQLIEPDSEDEE
jgi:hypothetical protein